MSFLDTFRNGLLFCALPFASALAQAPQFQREVDTIPVIVNGVHLVSPFAGGLAGSRPTFADIDNDDDFDLFVGEIDGNIFFHRNTGTATNPVFTLETTNLASIDVGSESAPDFVDIDNDGDFDLFAGETFGTIIFYRNTGTITNPAFVRESFASIDVGTRSTPTFADIDNDGDFDLFVGEELGNINFYRNTGTASNPIFTLETENFASINVGYESAPSFTDIDNDGDFDLFVGELGGNINFYRNTGSTTNPAFILETTNFASIVVGTYSTSTFADIDNDSDFDLFVGNLDGNLYFYRNSGTASNLIFKLESENFSGILDVGSRTKPTFTDIDNDGDSDLFVGNVGNISFYRNTGTVTNPAFTLETDSLASIDVGFRITPTFADIDNDGDFDLFVGESDGNLNFYRNTGTATNPAFTLENENFESINVGAFGYSAPSFIDIDNDGDFDLFVGEGGDFPFGGGGNINFYRNTGTPSNPKFTLETENLASIDVGSNSTPAFADIDNDNDFDLFVGEGGVFSGEGGNINFYRNTGTATNPVFTLATANFASIDVGSESVPIFVDIDNDGDFDLFVGEQDGGLYFYRNVAPTSISSREIEGFPNTFKLSQNYPNPFNPETTIQYQLPKTTQVKLTIYSLLGHTVATLVDKKQQAGFYSVDWDGKDDLGRIVASGVYLYRLETKEFVKVRKLAFIR